MDNIEFIINYNNRIKTTRSFKEATTKKEFDEFIRLWLGSDELKDYDIQYYSANGNKNILDKNQSNFLAPVFCCATVLSGVHSSTCAYNYVNIFIEPILQGDEDQIDASSSATCDLESQLPLFLSLESVELLEHLQRYKEDHASQENDSYSIDYQGDAAPTENIRQLEELNVDINPRMHTTSNNSDSNVKHIRMIHDVNPHPGRWRYISDVVPQRPAEERKSEAKRSHALLSGVKTPEQRNQHIRPIISIPPFVAKSIKDGASVTLLIASVTEEKVGNERVWRLHRPSEFRQPGCSADSDGVNPIEMDLNQESVQHGQFTIQVVLNKKPGQLGTNLGGLVLHKLDEDSVQKLHVAEHNNKLIRLAFILKINGLRHMNTFGLSGFMDFST
ncbi:unnamed protein product [Adineta steineri]|uniref:Uncharacterized protein n=1 Tax=Adineta steineri TaxID=433720 RepID=A0A814FXA3_9BILA|nr:unnamed protein product [Adineta steineri]